MYEHSTIYVAPVRKTFHKRGACQTCQHDVAVKLILITSSYFCSSFSSLPLLSLFYVFPISKATSHPSPPFQRGGSLRLRAILPCTAQVSVQKTCARSSVCFWVLLSVPEFLYIRLSISVYFYLVCKKHKDKYSEIMFHCDCFSSFFQYFNICFWALWCSSLYFVINFHVKRRKTGIQKPAMFLGILSFCFSTTSIFACMLLTTCALLTTSTFVYVSLSSSV